MAHFWCLTRRPSEHKEIVSVLEWPDDDHVPMGTPVRSVEQAFELLEAGEHAVVGVRVLAQIGKALEGPDNHGFLWLSV
jgi:hypothetical protein